VTPVARARALAEGAGEVLAGYFGRLRRGDAARKSSARDLVSEADLAAERHLVAAIPAGDDILSEEGSNRDRGAARCWVIDPLDGTVNFLHGLPFWCVSVGCVEGGALVAGAVHAPALRTTWWAAAGEGAFRNGAPVRVSATGTLSEALLATGFAYTRNQVPDHNLDNFTTLGFLAADLRRFGAAAIDLALVATGSLDGFWELHLNAWDVAAGALLVREAGGRVTDFHGAEDLDAVLFSRHVVASNGAVHDAIRAELAPLRGLA
jgi:myo-inositol-1(or 4)-monophosphatase